MNESSPNKKLRSDDKRMTVRKSFIRNILDSPIS